MTKKCLICNQKSKYTTNVSYHMFPKNEIKRKKWLDALNLEKTPNFNTAFVCSDHFDKTSYVHTFDSRRRERLIPDAVPIPLKNSVPLCLPEKMKIFEEPVGVNSDFEIITSSHNVPTAQSYLGTQDKLLKESAVFTSSSEEISSDPCSDESIKNHSFTDKLQNKKFRFMDGFKEENICRKDFVSDEAWNRFLKLTARQRLKMSTVQIKNLRNIKKIHIFKKLIIDLKKQNESEAIMYLKDLPQHVQGLVNMKELKQTAPHNLKSFAKPTHINSPAAYDWICTKIYEPGISNEIINNISQIVQKEAAKGRHLVFNISFDEDSILQPKKWNKTTNTWETLVNAVDSKSLVFILINIKAGFKAPVSYYLINSLNFIPSDSAFFINEQNLTSQGSINESEENKNKEETAHFCYHRHNYFKNEGWSAFDFAEKIVKHTAGAIVRIL